MADLSDFRLQRTSSPDSHEPERRSTLTWGLLLFVALLAGGGYWVVRHRAPGAATVAGPGAAAAAAAPRSALGGQPEAIEVPPLAQSDQAVRLLVQSLSAHPQVAAWLATDGLIRNFTVVVDNIASGQTPARHLAVLKPARPFSTAQEAGTLRVDPASYGRYDDLAAAVASIDPQGAARLYATLKPRIEEAHRELGENGPFDSALEEAIVRLARTPAVQDTRVTPKGALTFQYADPRVESLNDAQKLLLRMGPRNAAIVQDKLKQIGLALGIPASRFGG